MFFKKFVYSLIDLIRAKLLPTIFSSKILFFFWNIFIAVVNDVAIGGIVVVAWHEVGIDGRSFFMIL